MTYNRCNGVSQSYQVFHLPFATRRLSGEKETSESNVVFIILLKRVEHVKSVEKYNGSIYSILGRINFLCAFMDEIGHLLSLAALLSQINTICAGRWIFFNFGLTKFPTVCSKDHDVKQKLRSQTQSNMFERNFFNA